MKNHTDVLIVSQNEPCSFESLCRSVTNSPDGRREFEIRVAPLQERSGMEITMKNTKRCPKCNSQNIVRVPDNQNRHASGNNIYTSTFTLMKKIPVIRYVCCDCGYVENWVETQGGLGEIKRTFG